MRSSLERQGRARSRLPGRMLTAGVGVVMLALAAGACSSPSGGASSAAPVKGGIAVMAEPPSLTPNYIFPFASSVYASNENLFDLDWLMYRPLYWFGNGAQPTVNNSLSLAYPRPASRSAPTPCPAIRWRGGWQLRGREAPAQLGHGQFRERLVVLASFPAHRQAICSTCTAGRTT
jgi:hypothetical protein